MCGVIILLFKINYSNVKCHRISNILPYFTTSENADIQLMKLESRIMQLYRCTNLYLQRHNRIILGSSVDGKGNGRCGC